MGRRGFASIGTALLVIAGALLSACHGADPPRSGRWQQLQEGLEFGNFDAPLPFDRGDGKIRVVRADPKRFALKLLNASAQPNGKPLTPRQWGESVRAVAAINAAMFQEDRRTSVGLMLTPGHINNPNLTRDLAVLMFDPIEPSLPAVTIIDRERQDFAALRKRYRSQVQSIRMLTNDGTNVWEQQPGKRWSVSALGVDRQGRPLFIHSRSPYTVHDLGEMLRDLPLELRSVMYTEGGPEAQLYLGAAGRHEEWVGMIEDGPRDAELETQAWPIPNVLALVPHAAR